LEEAYTLWDCGASHKFVNPEFVDQVHDGETKIKSHCRSEMLLTTAGQIARLPLKEVQLTLDMGGYQYTGWFVVYKLANYDSILGKNRMEEVSHHVELQWNIIWLGLTALGHRFKYCLDGLKRNEEVRKCEGMTITTLVKPFPTQLVETSNMEDLAGDLAATAARYEKLTTAMV
jgi:hypothetical protein